MTVKIEKLERVFLFDGAKLSDVNPEFSVEQVRDMYVNTYPELASAVDQAAGTLIKLRRAPTTLFKTGAIICFAAM